MSTAYTIRGLTKQYGKSKYKANDNLSFDIHEEEIFGVLGANGAGKTTLVHQLSGLTRPTSGIMELFGIDIARNSKLISYYIALQPQRSTALLNLYPQEAIFYTARFRGMSRSEAKKQTNALMEELNLDKLRDRHIRTMSGGQQKLVTLAVAFVGNRPVQIFDEPTNDLDPTMRRLIWDKLLQQNRQGITIILITHNVLEAEKVVQRVGIMKEGQMVALGTLGELKARVDQRVRLEILFKTESQNHRMYLEPLGEIYELTRYHWRVLCDRNTLQSTINEVLSQIGLEQMDDFRILTPSLEDVYLQLGGTTIG